MKFLTLDIDGVLNNYPFCWLDYIDKKINRKFKTIEDAKKSLGQEEYSKIKESYRTSGYKKSLPINPLAVEFTKQLKTKGYSIIISTSRPFHLYPNLEKLTYDWLKQNHITFDYLEKKNNHLLSSYPNIKFHIDDELEHSLFFLEKNINVFIIRRSDINYVGYEKYKSLQFVNNLNDILSYI